MYTVQYLLGEDYHLQGLEQTENLLLNSHIIYVDPTHQVFMFKLLPWNATAVNLLSVKCILERFSTLLFGNSTKIQPKSQKQISAVKRHVIQHVADVSNSMPTFCNIL